MVEQRDYANYDLEEEHSLYVQPWVFWYLIEELGRSNFRLSWMIDPGYGIGEIAYGASKRMPSYPYEHDLVTKHSNCANWNEEHDRLAELARGYVHAVYLALSWFIEAGYIEFEFSMGWPCLRLTRTAITFERRDGIPDGLRKQIERIDELRTMPYQEYLASEEWRYRRELHIEAAGGRCQLCNSDDQPLHVHHRTYENRGRENFYDLVALCGTCHEWFHKSGRKVR